MLEENTKSRRKRRYQKGTGSLIEKNSLRAHAKPAAAAEVSYHQLGETKFITLRCCSSPLPDSTLQGLEDLRVTEVVTCAALSLFRRETEHKNKGGETSFSEAQVIK